MHININMDKMYIILHSCFSFGLVVIIGIMIIVLVFILVTLHFTVQMNFKMCAVQHPPLQIYI